MRNALGEPAPYWDQTGLMWGTYDGQCLELSCGDCGDIELLKFRIDLRSREIALVERVLAFARQRELLLLNGEAEAIGPSRGELAAAARNCAEVGGGAPGGAG